MQTVKSTARWLWDHKRLVVGTTVAAAGAYAGYVVWQKKRELDALCEELMGMQGGASKTDESRAREHFDATQQEVGTVMAREVPKVQAQLKRLLDTEALTQQLRSGQKFDQAQWNELKLMIWTRLVSSVYAVALLELKLRIHINIVARHYLHETSAAHAAGAAGDDAAGGGDAEPNGGARAPCATGALSRLTKLRFLSTEPLCADGFEPLVRAVRAAVEAEVGGVSLDRQLSVEELGALLGAARARLEEDGAAGHGAVAPVRALLLDGLDAGGAVAAGDQLGALLDEVREILRSEPYRLALQDVLGAAHAALLELLRQRLEAGAAEGAGALPARTPMAKLLPRLNRLLPSITAEERSANPIAEALSKVPALEEFSWMVFTAGPLFAAR